MKENVREGEGSSERLRGVKRGKRREHLGRRCSMNDRLKAESV